MKSRSFQGPCCLLISSQAPLHSLAPSALLSHPQAFAPAVPSATRPGHPSKAASPPHPPPDTFSFLHGNPTSETVLSVSTSTSSPVKAQLVHPPLRTDLSVVIIPEGMSVTAPGSWELGKLTIREAQLAERTSQDRRRDEGVSRYVCAWKVSQSSRLKVQDRTEHALLCA